MRTAQTNDTKHNHATMGWLTRGVFGLLAVMAVLVATAAPTNAAVAPDLGTAATYGVLGGQTVTNTGLTTITGDIGVDPGSAITDNGTLVVSGATHAADAESLQAQSDVTTAYDVLAGSACDASFTGTAVEIGNQTLLPGSYCYSADVLLTGTLTLNGDGVYIFQIGTALNAASGSTVALIGAQPCNVFWQVGSSAVLFTGSTFVGSILALTSVSLETGTTLDGRALARNGSVTLDNNVITSSVCALAPTATPTTVPVDTATTVPAATSTSTPIGAPTSTPVPGTATPFGTPAASTVVASPTGPAGTPTQPTGLVPPSTGLPPASPIEPPSVGSPPTRFPDAGGAPVEGTTSPWFLALLASLTGVLALGLGIRARHGRSRRTTR